ncbi:MAG: dihydroxy-acid dehydratase [Lautropia sp.]
MSRRDPQSLRSHRWMAGADMRSFDHRSRMAQLGRSEADYRGKPIIGIVNTWSELNPCHSHLRSRADDVKAGVWQAGGFPAELPAFSIDEGFIRPTSMLYRNLLAIETEEAGRCHPIDGLVLLGGCDKTVPALMMGALSLGVPFVFVPAGPMATGIWRGREIAMGADTRKYYGELRAGTITPAQYKEMELGIGRSPGTCATAGTASTMAIAVEAMGLSLPGAAGIPATDAAHARMASEAGRCIVEMVWEDRTPARLLSQGSVDNAVIAVMALGGSTNAIPHLLAMIRRTALALDLDRFDAISARVPTIANLRPHGAYQMEHFFRAGGSRAFLERLRPLLDTEARTCSGRTLGEEIAGAEVFDDEVILPLAAPFQDKGGMAVLRGNLAPRGAVVKTSAASPDLLVHEGEAVVFEDYDDYKARIDDPALPVTPDSVLVVKSLGPKGGVGMPEAGMFQIPRKMLEAGVRDMVRISDARMSGGSFGTCVVHVAPESHVGGPLALVRSGDRIALDVPGRRLELLVDPAELERRRMAWTAPPERYPRGWVALHMAHVQQVDEGCDFDFMGGTAPTPEPQII